MIPINWNEKQCGVYCIRHKTNGKVYIGSSVNCYHRIKSQHLARLRKGIHTNPHLQAAFGKYGEESFEYFIIEECDPEEMLTVEQKQFALTRCLDPRYGYNINPNAEKTELTEEQCEKIRIAKLGKKRSKKSHVGVYKSGKNWMVKIGFHGEEIYLGSYKNRKDAESVYRSALESAKNGHKPDCNLGQELRIKQGAPVLKVNPNTGEITQYESARAASRAGFLLPCILACCHGKRKIHKGFLWSFK